MKKKILLGILLSLALGLTACGEETTDPSSASTKPSDTGIVVDDSDPFEAPEYTAEITEEPVEITPEPEVEVIPEGMYKSELTGLWIDEALQNQRPIAVMVDNEKIALDHYGVNSCDVVYELMNSTANNRVTRLMCIMKDWGNITQLGSVRSARPTNFMLAAEYNAILIHDGGPFYIDPYVAAFYTNNLSGGFGRFTNGKHWEYTEYVTYDTYTNPDTGKSYDGLAKRIEKAKYDTEYNGYYMGPHFNFADKEFTFDDRSDAVKADYVILPFPHNSSELHYNEETGLYEYYEYGKAHVDPLDDNNITSFENVILQSCGFYQYDDHGYMIYNIECGSGEGYYLTNGKAIPITWDKWAQTDLTNYVDISTGENIIMNPGKTYIAIVPSDKWSELELTEPVSGN